MIDMSGVMIAKSDQINAPDLLDKPRTIKIANVRLTGKEQATEIAIVGDEKVYRPCKSMVRVMARAWGIDGEKWIGQSATLYCDPKVRFGKDLPGGIRISHLSGLRSKLVICLQASKGVLKNYEIEPLQQRAQNPAAPIPSAAAETLSIDAGQPSGAASNEAADPAAEYAAGAMDKISAAETVDEIETIAEQARKKLARRPELLAGIETAAGFKVAFLNGGDA